MTKYIDNIGYSKLWKGTGIFILMFVAMCWVLTKTEEHNQQVKSQQTIVTPVEAVPAPPVEESTPKVMTYHYTPKELRDAFDANEVQITHKLEGNILILKGKISKISLSFDKPVISISIPGSYDTIQVYYDNSDYMVDKISKLNVGDYILVASRDVSLNPFGTIHLRKSALSNEAGN
jgi:hypothetical protein